MTSEEQLLRSHNFAHAMQWLHICIKCGKTGGHNELKMLLNLN